jgi:hypothetical protein
VLGDAVPDLLVRFLFMFIPLAVVVILFAVLAPLTGRYQRPLLLVASCVSTLVLFGSCFTLVAIGGRDADLTVRNDTDWPVGIYGLNVEKVLIPPHQSKAFFVPAGPGWIDGLIDDVVVVAGPTRSTRMELHGITGLEHGTITLTNEAVAPGGGG